MKIRPYGEQAGEYDDWFSRTPFAYASELQAVRMLLPRRGTGVEIGVGTGRFAGEIGIPLGSLKTHGSRVPRQGGYDLRAGRRGRKGFRYYQIL